jgi:TM2 domain-containing membrane protein YozV
MSAAADRISDPNIRARVQELEQRPEFGDFLYYASQSEQERPPTSTYRFTFYEPHAEIRGTRSSEGMNDLTPLQRAQMAEVERMRAAQATGTVEPAPKPAEPAPEPPTPTPGVMAKNPGIAVLLSFFIPGLGHLYAGAVAWGLVILVLHILNWTVILLSIGLPPAAFIGLFIWIGGMKYSHKAAQEFNRRNGLTIK